VSTEHRRERSERMTKSEAASLRRIVRERFKYLRAQMPVREQELAAQVQAELEAEGGALIELANQEGAELMAEQADLDSRIESFRRRQYDVGLVPRAGRYSQELDRWVSKETEAKMRRAWSLIRGQRRQAELDLQHRELGLVEVLTIRELHSGEAMEFLARIPQPEMLLERPREADLLEAGEDP
jgi:hypothetical protein